MSEEIFRYLEGNDHLLTWLLKQNRIDVDVNKETMNPDLALSTTRVSIGGELLLGAELTSHNTQTAPPQFLPFPKLAT
jgi:hypothetical protein